MNLIQVSDTIWVNPNHISHVVFTMKGAIGIYLAGQDDADAAIPLVEPYVDNFVKHMKKSPYAVRESHADRAPKSGF